MPNEVKVLLAALAEGSMSLDQVARKFRNHPWPANRAAPTTTYEQLAAAELADPDPYVPGSFDDVTAAYHRGDLTDEQYDILAQAMTESVQAAEEGNPPRQS